MPGPRSEAGGGGSQVEVKVGRERSLTSRAAVDSAAGKTSGGGRLGWHTGLATVPVSGAHVQGLEEAAGRWVSRLGGRARAAVLARALLPAAQLPSRPGGWSRAGRPHELRLGAPCAWPPGPRAPESSCGQRAGIRPLDDSRSCSGLSGCQQVHR